MIGGRRIRRTRRGDFELRLTREEREVLRELPDRLREVLRDAEDPVHERLFPAAYPDDRERDAEYRRLVGDDLLHQRLAAVDRMEATIDAERVSEEDLLGWLGSLNDLRLVLGLRLDVREDMTEADVPAGEPEASSFRLYSYLTWLEEQLVRAIAT